MSVQCSIAFPMAAKRPKRRSAALEDVFEGQIVPIVASAVVFKSVAIPSRVAINSVQDCSRADIASYSFFLFRNAWAVAVCAEDWPN